METKGVGLYRKGEPFKDMAHPMETKTQFYQKGKPFENMAHRVDMAEDFKTSFIQKTARVGQSGTKTQRINSLTLVFISMNEYMSALGIEKDSVDKKRGIKADANGRLDEGWIRVRGETRKLVRDNIPRLPKRENDANVTFERADRKEHLQELDKKLTEEAGELMYDAKTEEKRIEELSDLSEVLHAIIKYRDINPDEVLTRVHALETKERIRRNQARRKLAKKK